MGRRRPHSPSLVLSGDGKIESATDARYGDRLTQIRREVFGDNFPGSALITITAVVVPGAKVEIQGYAVIGGK